MLGARCRGRPALSGQTERHASTVGILPRRSTLLSRHHCGLVSWRPSDHSLGLSPFSQRLTVSRAHISSWDVSMPTYNRTLCSSRPSQPIAVTGSGCQQSSKQQPTQVHVPGRRRAAVAAAAAAGPGPEEDEELKEEFEEYEEGEYEEGEEYEEYEEGEEGAAEGVPAALPPAAASGDSAPAQQQQQRGSGEADEGEYEEGEYEEGGKGEGEGEGEVVIGAGGYPEPPQHHMFLSDVMHMTGEDLLAAYVLAQPATEKAMVYGITDDVDSVVQGDMFVCRLSFDLAKGIVDRHSRVAEAVQAGATSILADVEQEAEVEALLDAMVKQQRGEGEAADEDEEFEGEEGADEYEARPRQRASKADAKEGEGEGAAAGKGGEEASSSGREVEQVRQALRQVPFMKLIHGVPVFFVEDVDDMASKLACALYDGPSLNMRTIAVGGTSGKTTVSWLIRGILEEMGQLTGMMGSIEYSLAEDRLDDVGDLWEPDTEDPTADRECTSPFHLAPYQGKYCIDYSQDMDGIRMQKVLAGMCDRGATAAIIEASTEALCRGWLEYVEVDVAVWTCFEEEPRHVALHGSMEAYLDSKMSLFEGMQDSEKQRIVLNLDDSAAKRIQEAAGVPMITYSILDRRADVWAESMQLTAWETEVIVRVPGGRRLQIISSLVGRHNVYNILAAVAVGLVLGAPLEAVVAGIEAVTVIPGRSEVVNSDPEDPVLRGDFPVMVDAADSPARVATLLDNLREAGVGRIFTVIGCDGETTNKTMRTQIGAAAFSRSDVVIVTNTSPRRELPDEIVADIMDGLPEQVMQAYATYVYNPFQDQGRVPLWFEPWLHSAQRRHKRHVMEDRFSAIRAAIGTARPQDAVVLLGQGHRDWVEHWDGNEEEPGLKKGWFDDRVEARNALSKLEYLYSLVQLDRSKLPWGHSGGEADRSTIWEEPLRDDSGTTGRR